MHLKICCIATPAEAARAIGAGASALGLVSAMPSGPGVIDEATIASIAAVVSPPIETYLLTSEREATAIAAQHARCRTTTLQLVDRLASHDEYQRLRALVEGVTLVQVIHVLDESSIVEALELAPRRSPPARLRQPPARRKGTRGNRTHARLGAQRAHSRRDRSPAPARRRLARRQCRRSHHDRSPVRDRRLFRRPHRRRLG
jgi:phosphoribosylanthranilate isomerase